jgi:DNA adenine methylase
MATTIFSSPLRYPGGKEDIAQRIENIIVQNDLIGCEYAEPFAGGAGLALHMLFDGYVSHVYLNDISVPVFAFWTTVFNDTEQLCKNILNTSISVEEWLRQKEILSNPEKHTITEIGFAGFF